ncbi:A-kinase-interacting protein 1 isoform X2 [Cuculus canorus]|uniref:A-kinase-interacting protein 1 isoform X2 n=1 Tax=Cuculus canorus TaxID=55661 RepID=UPI0023AAB1A9|nr:A-kinase-interacting protein 1 isoform X2 [Cuculus canorus]
MGHRHLKSGLTVLYQRRDVLWTSRHCFHPHVTTNQPINTVSLSLVQKYYSFVAACRCKEHEVKHICRYHGRQAWDRETEFSKEERTEASVVPRRARTCQQHTRKASKDIYIEVSPGTYSVTATSEDMVQQTHVVDVIAGQSVDLTFVL